MIFFIAAALAVASRTNAAMTENLLAEHGYGSAKPALMRALTALRDNPLGQKLTANNDFAPVMLLAPAAAAAAAGMLQNQLPPNFGWQFHTALEAGDYNDRPEEIESLFIGLLAERKKIRASAEQFIDDRVKLLAQNFEARIIDEDQFVSDASALRTMSLFYDAADEMTEKTLAEALTKRDARDDYIGAENLGPSNVHYLPAKISWGFPPNRNFERKMFDHSRWVAANTLGFAEFLATAGANPFSTGAHALNREVLLPAILSAARIARVGIFDYDLFDEILFGAAIDLSKRYKISMAETLITPDGEFFRDHLKRWLKGHFHHAEETVLKLLNASRERDRIGA